MQDKENLGGDLQTILDHISRERRESDNHVNDLITEVKEELKEELKEVRCKLTTLQKGVSNLQSVKTDMKQVKKNVPQIKADTEQLKKDVDTVTSDWEYKRDEEENLIPLNPNP